jgi:peptide deformylase
MSIREIVTYPNSVLSTVCEPVTVFDDDLRTLIADMFETMYAAQGVGLAAPQIGVNKRVFVIDSHGENAPNDPMVFINPDGIAETCDVRIAEEGCLSLPGFFARVVRPSKVSFIAQKEDGTKFECELTGWLARVFLHENDHLDGVLINSKAFLG